MLMHCIRFIIGNECVCHAMGGDGLCNHYTPFRNLCVREIRIKTLQNLGIFEEECAKSTMKSGDFEDERAH